MAPAASPLAGAGAGLPAAFSPGDIASLEPSPTSYGAITTIGAFSGEPNIAAGPDGTVYVTGLGWDGTMVFRRLPGASSFTYMGVPNYGYGGNDEALAVGPDGKVWVAGMYGFWQPGGACASATVSSDRAQTWGPTVPGLCDLEQGIDRQWIAVDELGHGWVSVHEICCTGQHAAYRSTDGGATWGFAGVVAANGGFPGNLVADRARGEVHQFATCTVALSTKIGICDYATPTLAPLPAWRASLVSRYTFTPPGLAHVAGAADDAGNLYVTWTDKSSTELRPGTYVARSTDGGLTWSTPARVSDASKLGTMPWVAAGADGNVALVWYEASAIGTDPNLVSSSTPWHVKAAIIKGWTGATMPAPTVTQLSTTPVKHGPICTMGAVCPRDEKGHQLNRELLDFFEATVGPDGTLHVVWPEVGTWVMRVADVDADLR